MEIIEPPNLNSTHTTPPLHSIESIPSIESIESTPLLPQSDPSSSLPPPPPPLPPPSSTDPSPLPSPTPPQLTYADLFKAGFGPRRFPTDRSFRALFSWSIASLCVSFLLLLLAWLWVVVIFDYSFSSTIAAMALITSSSSPSFKDFTTSPGDSPTLPPFYESWLFFNLTNSDQVQREGALPVVQQLGPYYYRMLRHKLNISWSPNRDLIFFRQCEAFVFDENLTLQHCPLCDPDRDVVVNVNPGYMGAVMGADGESNLKLAFTGPSMLNVFEFLLRVFVPDTISRFSAPSLSDREQRLGGPSPAFFATWANATMPPSPDWNAMLVSVHGSPSEIPLSAAEMLFDPSYPYSLRNASAASYQLWARLVSTDSTDAKHQLSAVFGITLSQTGLIADWLRAQFWPFVVEPQLLSQFDVPCVELLSYVQWGTGSVSPTNARGQHLSIQALYPEERFGAKPEFALWGTGTGRMPWQNALMLWGDITACFDGSPEIGEGLFSAPNWATFGEYGAIPANMSVLREKWGITSGAQLRLLELYFSEMSDKIAVPDMNALAAKGGGVITKRTVNSWAFRAIDPLVLLLEPAQADVAIQPNISGLEACLADPSTEISAYDTGKDDLSRIANTVSYGNLTQWPVGWYNASYPPYRVHGTNTQGQFQPFLASGQPLAVFDNQFMRTLNLEHVANVTIDGVDAFRYTLALDNFYAPNYPFSISDPNFQGFANLSGPQEAPIYLSQAHMFMAASKYVNKITGMPPADPETDPTFVDIEPYTGKAIAVSQALQMNIYNPCTPNWFASSPFGNQKFTCDVMFPIAIVRQLSQLGPANVDQIQGQLYLGLFLKKVIYGVLLLLGLGAIALCAFLAWLGLQHLRRLPIDSVV